MKRTFITAVLVAALIALWVTPLWAQSGTPGLEYELMDSRGYIVNRGSATSGDVVIPSTYNGRPVTSIRPSAFHQQPRLTSITIPDSITSIGGSAFLGCTSLTSITIPASVTSVGTSAFALWTGSQSINTPGYANQAASDTAWVFDNVSGYRLSSGDWRYNSGARVNYGSSARTATPVIGNTPVRREYAPVFWTLGYSIPEARKNLISLNTSHTETANL